MTLGQSLRKAFRPWTSPFSRAFNKHPATQRSRELGENSELFNYTSGRWLYNESLRLIERTLNFNIIELKKAAAAAVNKDVASVQSFNKLAEGGFNRTLEITIDGLQVIARLPYPSTYPKHYSVANEVATMTLVRSYGVPVPKILAYSATHSNAVGTEYIIMEKARGKEIGDVWYELSEKERMKVVVQVARVDPILYSFTCMPKRLLQKRSEDVIDTVDVAAGDAARMKDNQIFGQMYVGPDVAQKWWFEECSCLGIPRGPFSHTDQASTAGSVKELAWLKTYAHLRLPHVIPHRELYGYQKVSPDDHIASVEEYLQIAPYLLPKDDEFLLRPTLSHPDLQSHNISVADDFTITSVIDWQHSSVLPLIFQAGVPEYFQNFDYEESHRLKKPSLPQSFDRMRETEQAEALEQYRRRQLHYYYFVATYKFNKLHYDTLLLNLTMAKQKLHEFASASWEGDSISLKENLIRAVQNWPILNARKSGEVPPCPIRFSDAEVEECLRLEAGQSHLDVQMEKIRNRIAIGSDGRTSSERYEVALEENEHIKAEALCHAADDVKKEILENWPWDDHEED